MNRTAIEWVRNPDGTPGYTSNELTGCQYQKDGLCMGGGFPCYACKLANTRLDLRYRGNTNLAPGSSWGDYADPFYPRLWPEKFDQVRQCKTPRGIFHCDMSDWLGGPHEWSRMVYQVCVDTPWHRHYLLTKQAQKLHLFSPYPEQCWVGVTVTSNGMMTLALTRMAAIEAAVKYLSIEPLLGSIGMDDHMSLKHAGINQVIIGACTGTRADMAALCQRNPGLTLMQWGKRWTAQPRIEWVQEIVQAADRAGVKVFLKDNLKPLFLDYLASHSKRELEPQICLPHGALRQEMPD